MLPNFVKGSTTGTGAAITISLGFQPDFVKIWNPNDAGSLWPTLEWTSGMAADSGFKTLKVVDNGATGNATTTKITTGGITTFAGTAGSAAAGFTIGTDADINANGEVIYYIAMRNGPGV